MGKADETPAGYVRVEDIQAAVALQVEEVLSRMVPASANGDMADFAKALTAQLASLTDQGVGRSKKVEPHVLLARDAARERMTQLILDAHKRGAVPTYKLKNKVYLDEIMVDPMWVGPDHVARPTLIDWPGVPNEAMSPENDVARDIFAAFLDSIGSVVKAPDAPLAVTAGGLVIQGRGPSRREAAHVGQQQRGEGLKIRGRGVPGAIVETAVLGTLAAPARQMPA